MMNNLQFMFEIAEKDVGFAQLAGNLRINNARALQPLQRVKRGPRSNRALLAAVQHLQCLYKKLNLANSTAAQLHMTFESNRFLDLFIDADFDIANLVDCCKIEVLSIDKLKFSSSPPSLPTPITANWSSPGPYFSSISRRANSSTIWMIASASHDSSFVMSRMCTSPERSRAPIRKTSRI